MTTKKTEKAVTITILASGLSVPDQVGRVYSANRTALRGEVLTLSPEQVESTLDLAGNSWLDMDDEAQLARWGVIRFRKGDHVEAEKIKFLGDDDERIRYRRRERDELAARKIADPAERKAEFDRINKLYGARDTGQRTIQVY